MKRRIVDGKPNAKARDAWNAGDGYRAGLLLYRDIQPEDRPRWASDILEAACAAVPNVPDEVKAVIGLALRRDEWHRAHRAFDAVRALTLKLERTDPALRDERLYAVLFVAENAAKVIYNCSGESAPFDADCGAWLVRCAHDLSSLLGAGALRGGVEDALFG